ncbi:MAG TPA: Hsp70 family protein [Rudaea sp.]|nr:Hsp70 family protein [Rudaea sp.]
MNHSDLELQLLARLRAKGKSAAALGIDLGTTKSSVACASFDADTGTLTCECLQYDQGDGTRRVAVPSVAARDGERLLFGAPALARRRRSGVLPERDIFFETKNLIGLRYTYARAPQGLRNPSEVAAQLLRHLRDGIADATARNAGFPAVVAVPASFHGAQRQATVAAARAAFAAKSNDAIRLIDEPYAAFVDLKFRNPERADALLREDANILVFDFGGGTCDVAIFRVDAINGGTLGARLSGTSRYHRLGGGDIDRAIVHDVLIPALIEQNELDRFAFSWFEKRRKLEPQLLEVAERLKVALSLRVAALHAAGKTADDAETVRGVALALEWQGATLFLDEPSLSLAQFDKLMRPFLDPEPAPEAGDEYVQRSSMFSPIAQALMRAHLEPHDIHGILLCGSSSLLPCVQHALAKKFPDAGQALLGDAEQLQGAVARGAALQALSLQVLGEPLIAPVCSAELSLRVVSGTVPLLRAGERVPSASRESTLLRPPRDSAHAQTDIAVEVVADANRIVGRSLWRLPAPVSTRDRLALDWRMDDNQCVELRLARMDNDDTEPFVQRFDAPIMHRDPGQLVRCRLLEREEAIRNDEIPRAEHGEAFEQHAKDCATLGEFEKALHFLSLAMQEKGATRGLLNLRGIYRERIGDRDGAMDSYREAGEWSATHFNAGLLLYNHDEFERALADVDYALEHEPRRAYRVLRGDILDKMGKKDEARLEWQDALAGTMQLQQMDDFELGWLESAARKLDDGALRERIKRVRKQQAEHTVLVLRQGELPEVVDTSTAQREIL